jgi:3-methyladenine DNA glycosylase AlkD
MQRVKSVHPYHQELVRQIKKQAAEANVALQTQADRYVGTLKPCYMFRTAVFHEIIQDWIKRHADLTLTEYVDLLNSLSQGATYNEFISIGVLLGAWPQMRKALEPHHLDVWLDHAQGWAEVDTICQSNFTAREMLCHWKEWKSLLVSFSKSDNVHKRRASLVLLTRPLRESADPRLARLAFANLDRLKTEKDILVTKAVSWLLRALIKYHREEVETYLRDNADSLPKIALRETRNKLTSGRKSGQL